MDAPSIFPPSAPKGLPHFSTLLVSGSYHPSAPIHLALSLRSAQKRKSIIIHPSRSDFQADLLRFNDAWLISRSNNGKIADLASKIDIFYPPSPAHLCMLLSVLCASDSGKMKNMCSSIKSGPPSVVILVELSRFFFSNSHGDLEINSTLSSYLNIIQRALASLSSQPDRTTTDTRKIVLFECRLNELKAPLTDLPSIFPDGHPLHQPRQVQALRTVEKYFEVVGIVEDDSSFISSSQTDEVQGDDDGVRKQLRIYCPKKPLDSYVHCRWSERTCLGEGTWFEFMLT